MTTPDTINGAYELLGGFAILAHIRTLFKDKQVRGINFLAIIFFASWGVWNLYYYPHLNQWMSFAGGESPCRRINKLSLITLTCLAAYRRVPFRCSMGGMEIRQRIPFGH